jgi:hypothetical protein
MIVMMIATTASLNASSLPLVIRGSCRARAIHASRRRGRGRVA